MRKDLDQEGISVDNIYFHSLLTKSFAYLDMVADALPGLANIEENIGLLDSLGTQVQAGIRCDIARTYFWVGGSSAIAEGHAQAAVDLLKRTDELNTETGFKAFRILASAIRDRGDIESLVGVYLKMIQIDQAIAPMSVRTGQLHFWLGGYYQNMGRYPEAASEFAKSEQIFRAVYAPSQHFAYLENALGNMEESQGNLTTSLIYYQRALDIFAEGGITSYNTANVNMNIANVLRRLDRTDSALIYAHRAVDIYDENPAPIVRASRAHMYHDLSRIYAVKNDYRQALSVIQEGLHILDPEYALDDVSTVPRHLEGQDSYVQIYLLNAKASSLHNLVWSDSTRDDWLSLSMMHLQANLDLIDSVRKAYYFPGNIDAFRRVSTNCYESAVAMALKAHAETGEQQYLKKAFAWVEASRAYQLQSDLFRIRARPYTFYPDSLLRLEEETQSTLKSLQKRLTTTENDPRLEQVLSERIYSLSTRIGDIHKHIARDYPEFIRFQKRQEIVSLEELKSVHPAAIIIRFFHNQLDSAISAFYTGPNHDPSLLSLSLEQTRSVLADIDTYLALLQNRDHATRPDFDPLLIQLHQKLGYRMYEALLAPVLDSLQAGAETPVLIIP
ncbi:MAG: tetratricopeptide repeat protein, partial [Bacteroidota bacterium]